MFFVKVPCLNGSVQFKNIIEKKYFEDIDYIKRFEQLFQEEQTDQQDIKSLHKCLFEDKIENVKYSLNKAKEYHFLLE